jgi:hypothetical protein
VLVGQYFGDRIIRQIEPGIQYLSYQISRSESTLAFITSGRTGIAEGQLDLVTTTFSPLNYLFGGHDQGKKQVESDLIDTFLFLGVSGVLLFWSAYFRLFMPHGARGHSLNLLFFLVWFGVAAVAGHLVFSAINGAYLAIVLHVYNARHTANAHPRRISSAVTAGT